MVSMARWPVVLVIGLLAVACSPGTAPQPRHTSTSTGSAIVAQGVTEVALLPKDRFALPTFDFDRFQALLKDMSRARVPLVVNIWASWCGPCRLESPNLVKAAARYGSTVQFLGVDILDQRPAARAFITEEGYPYPSVFDPIGEIRDRLGYIGQPVTIFYDAHGRRVSEWTGPIGLPQLIERIRLILP